MRGYDVVRLYTVVTQHEDQNRRFNNAAESIKVNISKCKHLRLNKVFLTHEVGTN